MWTLIYSVSYPDHLGRSNTSTEKTKIWNDMFSISAVSPTNNSDILPYKIITDSHCTFTQITTQLSAGPTISSQFCWFTVYCWVIKSSHQAMTAHSWYRVCPVVCEWQFAACCYVLLCVSGSLQLVVMSCCVWVTVCSLLLCPVVCQWQFAARYVLLCVSDSLQLVVMSCCVSVTVCSSLCPVVCQWQFAACCYVLLCVSDSLQLVNMFCCLSVTVCSLLLCPVVCQWQFPACCYVLFIVCVCVTFLGVFASFPNLQSVFHFYHSLLFLQSV